MKHSLAALALILAPSFAFAFDSGSCPALPSTGGYTLDQVYLTWGTDFKVHSQEGEKVGIIREKKFRLNPYAGKAFKFYDGKGRLVAVARRRILAFLTKIDVYDCHGSFIGGLRKKVISKAQGQGANTFEVIDARKKMISQSRKTDTSASEITFYDDRGSRIVAQARRPQINVTTDSWDVQIYDDKGIFDPRLFIFAPVFKTSSEAN